MFLTIHGQFIDHYYEVEFQPVQFTTNRTALALISEVFEAMLFGLDNKNV